MVQYYDIDVIKEFAIRGNAALMKCQIPSFVADFVSVVSWHTDQNEDFYPLANQDGNSFESKLKNYRQHRHHYRFSTRVFKGFNIWDFE